MITRKSLSYWSLRASLTAFVACLALPAYTTDYYGKTSVHYGLEAFLLGPVGLFAGHFSWLANLLLWLSWFKHTDETRGQSVVFAVLSLVLACSFLFGKLIAVGSAGEFPYLAATGYYVWLASMVMAAIAAFQLKE
ncbi:hypothetical protein [Undibacterium sp. KW1]|uniref:hypothetical protein n=1 Tax=Undibacterium sp. KW1 TaxID=2058624 RepID=UPI00138A4CC6|nr:hypothetical protein [Undibacterium sp. KW1]